MTLTLDDQLLATLYPAYVRTDPRGVIVAFGPSIGRHVPGAAVGLPWDMVFEHVGPAAGLGSFLGPERQRAVRIADRRMGQEFTGLLLCEPEASTYLLTPSPTLEGLGVEDFAPGDNRLANIITLTLQRALLAESREIIADLAETRRVAEAALRTQTEFLNGISHQLRTPLASLVLYLSPLEPGDGQKDHVRARSCDALMSLKSKIDNLIDYTALRTGELRPIPQWCGADRLRGAVGHLELRAAHKGLALCWRDEALQGRQIRIDPSLLDRLLDNLIGNAIENSDEGEVRIAIDLTPGPCLRMTVSDHGCGLKDAWGQAGLGAGWSGRQTSEDRPGIGIGLSICREIAAALGGAITHMTAGASGTVFAFEAPVEVR